MTIEHMSAITLAVGDMARSVDFYRKIGLELSHGGREANFTSFRVGPNFLNLILSSSSSSSSSFQGWWGRLIFRTQGVDSLHAKLKGKGLEPETPRDGEWGERYFHVKDPDAHELSFAELISSSETAPP